MESPSVDNAEPKPARAATSPGMYVRRVVGLPIPH
jgi:hypothetical protein